MSSNYTYAYYDDYDKLSYNCVGHLLDNNEDIWKILKYTNNSPLSLPNLTKSEKRSLVYSGKQQDTTNFRVFLDRGQDDALTDTQCILRVSPYNLNPIDAVSGKVSILFEVYCHNKINHISNDEYYTTRVDCIIKNLIKTFNGVDVGGLGVLSLNKKSSYDNGVRPYGTTPWKGSWLIMSNNMA